jgi:hypothetical protein
MGRGIGDVKTSWRHFAAKHFFREESNMSSATLERPAGARIDRAAGIIHGVKVLGVESANNRTYTPQALRDVARLCEGAVVNVDHVDPGARRSLRDRIGRLKDAEVRPDGVYATLVLNKGHDMYGQIMEDAEQSPRNLGLSIDARGASKLRDGRSVVESVDKVLSVDLVANPATTRGLFESTLRESVEDARARWEGRPVGGESLERWRRRHFSER